MASWSSRPQDVEDALDAFLPEGREAPDVRPPDPDRIGAERQRLEDVGAATQAAVHEHRNTAGDCRRDFGEAVD